MVWNTLDRSKDDNGFVMGRILEMKNKITWSVYQLSILVVLFGGCTFLSWLFKGSILSGALMDNTFNIMFGYLTGAFYYYRVRWLSILFLVLLSITIFEGTSSSGSLTVGTFVTALTYIIGLGLSYPFEKLREMLPEKWMGRTSTDHV